MGKNTEQEKETYEVEVSWHQYLRKCACGGSAKTRYVVERNNEHERPEFYWLVECLNCGKQIRGATSQLASFIWNGQN